MDPYYTAFFSLFCIPPTRVFIVTKYPELWVEFNENC